MAKTGSGNVFQSTHLRVCSQFSLKYLYLFKLIILLHNLTTIGIFLL